MSNIYSKVTIEKTDVLKHSIFYVYKFVNRSVFGDLQLTQISLNFENSYCNCVGLFYYFTFERNYGILKSKSPCDELELAKEKTGYFSYLLFCPKEIFFNICVLSQCIAYWMNFRSMHLDIKKHYFILAFACF